MITSLRCYHWRNLSSVSLDLDGSTIFLVGENGQGKSNLLEAIYYLIYQSSWRPFDLKTLLTQGERDGFALEGQFHLFNQINLTLSLKQQGSAKILTKDGEIIRDRREFLDVFSPLIFSPADLTILQGSPSRRRDFLDQTLTLLEPSYLTYWRRYARVLSQRNTLLRRGNETELDIFDLLFGELAKKLVSYRKDLIKEFSKRISYYSDSMLLGWGNLTLNYEASLDIEDAEEQIAFFQKKRAIERAQGFSLYGPHRDRFSLKKEGIDVSLQASHGQLRALVISLRLLQAELLARKSGKLPALLLDDILLELDSQKRETFFRLLPPYSQAFFTFLPDEPFHSYNAGKALLYRVRKGNFTRETL